MTDTTVAFAGMPLPVTNIPGTIPTVLETVTVVEPVVQLEGFPTVPLVAELVAKPTPNPLSVPSTIAHGKIPLFAAPNEIGRAHV